MPGSLRVVGTGIRAIGQTSPEAVACITQAQQVYYVLGDPVARAWIVRLNPTAQSLMSFYAAGKERIDTYHDVSDFVLAAVRRGLAVCMVTTGHPGVFSYAAQRMIRLARDEGYSALMLPGISAEDCLFADLGVDPGAGLQSHEATVFLMTRPPFDAASSLVLWQIGSIGEASCKPYAQAWNPAGVAVLGEVLAQTYGASHEVVVYEAARYAFLDPSIQAVTLAALGSAAVNVLSTLFVPAKTRRDRDPAITRRLAMT